MDDQPNLKWEMRGILTDWLIEVHNKFRLLPETLFLAINIADRFLSARVVSLSKLQLVGLTCLFIAAKYEEVICPSVSNFLYMADGGYTDEEIIAAEKYVLTTLNFDLSYPNPMHFLRRVSKAEGYDIQSRTVAKYLMEISLVDERFLSIEPSRLAASATWMARLVLGRDEWVSKEVFTHLRTLLTPHPHPGCDLDPLLWLRRTGAPRTCANVPRLHPQSGIPST